MPPITKPKKKHIVLQKIKDFAKVASYFSLYF